METDGWISISEAAEALGVHKNTIRHRIKTGVYPTQKVLTPNGQAYMLPRQILDETVHTPTNGVVPSLPTSFHDLLREAVEPLRAEQRRQTEIILHELRRIEIDEQIARATRGRLYHLRCLLFGDPDG